jgi:tRNA A-37 threonylcarbamoyl transferase component Bud32
MPKGALIARGRTAEIFEWGTDRVLKLYLDWCPARLAEYEAMATQAAYKAGLPVPEVDSTIVLENRHGVIMERIDGPTMMDIMPTRLRRLTYYAHMLADLQARIHSCHIPELVPQRFRLDLTIREVTVLPETVKKVVLNTLADLPDGDTVCHHDLHPMNVIISRRGPVIIDWEPATKGDPLSDVARTWLLLNYSNKTLPFPFNSVVKFVRILFQSEYLKHYSKLRPISPQVLEQWKIPIVAARLSEIIAAEEPRLLSLLRTLLPIRD